jgi:hypothetical protein
MVVACATTAKPPRFSGREVEGTYVEVDMRMRQTPPPRHIGHAAVQLDDGTLVYLEPPWSKEAIRPPDERRTLTGKRVIATGAVHAVCPEPKQPMAHVSGPCITPVENVTTR